MNNEKQLIKQIKSMIPNNKQISIDGHYGEGKNLILWWSVLKEGSLLWIEYEPNDGYGKCQQQAVDFSADRLQSVLYNLNKALTHQTKRL